MKPMVLEFKDDGLDELLAGVVDLASQFDLAAASERQLAAAMRSVSSASQRAAANVNTYKQAVVGLNAPVAQLNRQMGNLAQQQQKVVAQASRIPKAPPIADPMQALRYASPGAMAGNVAAAKLFNQAWNQQQAILRAQSRANLLQQANGNLPMAQMMSSSRLAVGPNGKMQMMPLMHQAMSAGLNPSVSGVLNLSSSAQSAQMLGAAATPIGVVIASIVALGMAAKAGADRLNGLNQAMYTGGGTMAETITGRRIGGLLGFDFASRATQFREVIGSGGVGSSVARNLGINPNRSIYGGDLNDTRALIKAIDKLSSPAMTDRQVKVALRAFGGTLDDIVPLLRTASPEMRARVLTRMADDVDPGKLQDAADTQIRFNEVLFETKELFQQLAVQVLPVVNGFLKFVMGDLSGNPTIPISPKERDQAKQAASREVRARDANTQALNELNTTLRNGFYGGGARGRGALPGGWNSTNIEWAATNLPYAFGTGL